jgi:hypothetical protein
LVNSSALEEEMVVAEVSGPGPADDDDDDDDDEVEERERLPPLLPTLA